MCFRGCRPRINCVEGKTFVTEPSRNQLSYLKRDRSYILILVSWQNSPFLLKKIHSKMLYNKEDFYIL